MNSFMKLLISLILFTSLNMSYASERNAIEQLLANPDVQQSIDQALDEIANGNGGATEGGHACIGPVCVGCTHDDAGCGVEICGGGFTV